MRGEAVGPAKEGFASPVCMLALLLAVWVGTAQAQPAEALAWMRKIHDATLTLDDTGGYIDHRGDRS